jgi:hypothetical protein
VDDDDACRSAAEDDAYRTAAGVERHRNVQVGDEDDEHCDTVVDDNRIDNEAEASLLLDGEAVHDVDIVGRDHGHAPVVKERE